ncbi:MAG: dihydrolipoyl dehydrogenase [Planctomycetes bacterium]|nr:dihydrolipoyl dehydrogenase [Planctomycetota bacterium]
MSTQRHVVVIGAGPAGYVCAIRLAQLGQRVTIVEKDYLGGTCLNVGCIPSKALIAAGALMERIHEATTMGISVEGVKLDLARLVAWKGEVVNKLTSGVGGLLKNHKVEHVPGKGRIHDARTVKVATASGEKTITCDDIVLATGSVPLSIPGFDFDKQRVWSSTEALAPERIPQHLLVIGGGYIGLELGFLYKKLGSQVTVVEFTEGALPGQDKDCVRVIERSLKKSGIKFITKTAAKSYEAQGAKLFVKVESAGKADTIECDQILCTVGRKPYSEGLGLESVGLKVDPRGFLAVDKQLRTAVKNIYAVGDLAGQPMLAHKGSKEGLVAAAVIAGQPEEYDVRCVPAVIFTSPEMASVGLQEDEAKKKGHEVVVGQYPFAANGRALSLLEPDGFVKIVADAKTDEVLGVHMVGPEVTELIAECTLAIEMGATTEDIARTIHAHPTLPEAVMEAAEAVHKMAVHIFQKK